MKKLKTQSDVDSIADVILAILGIVFLTIVTLAVLSLQKALQ